MMGTLRVKICGLTQPDQARAIAAMGADALGFICVPASPRYVQPEAIAAILQTLPEQTLQHQPLAKIGVFANATLTQIVKTVETTHLTGVQLHGQEDPQFCQNLRAALPEIELIKAFRIRTHESVVATQRYADVVDTFLLDAFSTKALGGTGETWDWSLLKTFQPERPWILAGGLTPTNVLTAISQLSPSGIDLASGVEHAPRDKNLQLVQHLFEQLTLSRHSTQTQ